MLKDEGLTFEIEFLGSSSHESETKTTIIVDESGRGSKRARPPKFIYFSPLVMHYFIRLRMD